MQTTTDLAAIVYTGFTTITTYVKTRRAQGGLLSSLTVDTNTIFITMFAFTAIFVSAELIRTLN